MEMTGERRIGAPRERVWEALNDPAVLQAAIPGCESVERIGDDQFQAKVSMKLGPMSAKFGGKVTLSNIVPPASYTISGEGQGGAMGFAKGGADVALEEVGPSETILRYNVKAQVGGKMAQLGARLIDSTAKSMADQFFDRFAAQLTPPEPVAVPGTDTEYLADTAGAAPITQHGAEGQSPGGTVHRPNQTGGQMPLPLRLLTQDFMGFPSQVWLGAGAMAVILMLLFVVG
jgi:carbon monoxide dehydrogenase subunit G